MKLVLKPGLKSKSRLLSYFSKNIISPRGENAVGCYLLCWLTKSQQSPGALQTAPEVPALPSYAAPAAGPPLGTLLRNLNTFPQPTEVLLLKGTVSPLAFPVPARS